MASEPMRRAGAVLYSVTGGARLAAASLCPRAGLPHRCTSGGLCAGALDHVGRVRRGSRCCEASPLQRPASESGSISGSGTTNAKSSLCVASSDVSRMDTTEPYHARRRSRSTRHTRLVRRLFREHSSRRDLSRRRLRHQARFRGRPKTLYLLNRPGYAKRNLDRARNPTSISRRFRGAGQSCVGVHAEGIQCLRCVPSRAGSNEYVPALRRVTPVGIALLRRFAEPGGGVRLERRKCFAPSCHLWSAFGQGRAARRARHRQNLTPTFCRGETYPRGSAAAKPRGEPLPLYQLASSEMFPVTVPGGTESNGDGP